MPIRSRLMLVTILGLVLTLSLWGWGHFRSLQKLLIHRQLENLYAVAETVAEYYQNFPTTQGITVLDKAMDDVLHEDEDIARIDIFSVSGKNVATIVGSSRVRYEWPDDLVVSTMKAQKALEYTVQTESGPGAGLLLPIFAPPGGPAQSIVGVIMLKSSDIEITTRARRTFVVSSAGLLLGIMLVLAFSYSIIIGRPLRIITKTMGSFKEGKALKRIPLKRSDEWGLLAGSFNLMADEIDSAMDKNRELTRQLEKRVQETTHKLLQLQTQVSQQERLAALGQLTAELTHNLGTPLHSIAGLTQLLLERENLPPDVLHKLNLIVQQTQRLDAVLQNVRKASMLPEPHFEPASLVGLLKDTMPLMESTIEESGIRLSVEIMDESLPNVYLDYFRVQTALLNLIQNAVESMPDGGDLKVSLARQAGGNGVVLSVEDTGPGIRPDLKDRVFEPFFTTHEGKGLRGLGLSIVRDIMKNHHGRAEVESDSGKGTKIKLYFPLDYSSSEPSEDLAGS